MELDCITGGAILPAMNTFTQNLLGHAIRDRSNFTTQPLEEAAAQASTSTECEFLRLPPPG
jgi:hypothetical protein